MKILFMKNIAVFGSGSGSNAENICRFFSSSKQVQVVLIGTNKKDARITNRAKKLKVPLLVFSKNELNTFTKLHAVLLKKRVEYVILAGFLLKIPEKMLELYKNKIINIHPSLLPKYGGKGMYGNNVHSSVLKNNDLFSGITVHLVNENYDEGEILFQKKCAVDKGDDVSSLSKKIAKLEYLYFPKIINSFVLK